MCCNEGLQGLQLFWTEEESSHSTKLLFGRFLRPARLIWTSINRFWLVNAIWMMDFSSFKKWGFTLASWIQCTWHPNYECWGVGGLQNDVAFWGSYWASGKWTCLKQNDLLIILLQPAKGSRITSLEVFDVTSQWSCGTNCVWRTGSDSCYLDVLHCLFVYSNQVTNRNVAFINCQTQKRKKEESDLKTSAVIAVQPFVCTWEGRRQMMSETTLSILCSFRLCFCCIASNFTIFIEPKESERERKMKHVWIMNCGLWLCLIHQVFGKTSFIGHMQPMKIYWSNLLPTYSLARPVSEKIKCVVIETCCDKEF